MKSYLGMLKMRLRSGKVLGMRLAVFSTVHSRHPITEASVYTQ